ncbi:hypothetical protein STIAU_8127 [Stigmatella aurantiaca DW4/3-1]|uniref:Uncharacterized protein n=1 Tax=Stigmatella aurantiaca (strain DW4/3-1) TaxID=378806 RepID=Q08VR4_STIAD|nr:hypothetical protein STIAU_8127 [Stigmatella aurantiaca DW4/3-1]
MSSLPGVVLPNVGGVIAPPVYLLGGSGPVPPGSQSLPPFRRTGLRVCTESR